MRLPFTHRFLLLAPAVLVACSGGDAPTSGAPPASASLSSTTTLSATVANVVTPSPTFVVKDASGNALNNVTVSIAVGSGGGTLTNAPTKSSSGGTSVGTWTLGNAAGTNTLIVTVNGLASPLTISATGTADVATQLSVASGNSQSALAGATLTSPVAFKVGDKFNNGVGGAAVAFAISAGGGSLPPGSVTVVSDANGLAVSPTWTMGKSTGTQQLRATSGTFTATATANVTSNYLVDVRFYGPTLDPSIQALFTAAAARIQGLVTGDVPPVGFTAYDVAGECGLPGAPPLNETIDDIVLFAKVDAGDGVGGVLASAGPCVVRNTGQLTVVAFMNFDAADFQTLVANGNAASVILHEMLHTVGVGTLWATKGQVSGSGTSSVAFVGQAAVAGCLFHGGSLPLQCGGGTVPVEAGFGAGTANVHWREATTSTGIGLNQELMTGFAEPAGVPMPLSRITIGSLSDVGYTVNLLPADSYTFPSTAAAALSQIREAQGLGKIALNEIIRQPLWMVDPVGRVTPIREKR